MKHSVKIGILILVNLLLLTFIFTRSAKSIPESRDESDRIMELIRPVLELVVGKGNVTEHLVRKLAHFTEFGLLGVTMTALICSIPAHPLWAFLLTLLSALTDETVQIFSERGSQVQDVWLDFGGAVCGILFLLALRLLWNRRKKRAK